MLQIKVLGPGCPNCHKVESAAKSAVASLGVQAEIEKITDYDQIFGYNILSTPGLVINEKVVSAGRIPSESEVSNWLAEALAAASAT